MTHNAFHRCLSLDDPRLDMSDEEDVLFNGADGMYMHLLMGRYTYKTLVLNMIFRKE